MVVAFSAGNIALQMQYVGAGPLWVKSAGFTFNQPLPVYPDQRTLSGSTAMSVLCHGTKSLRSSPLRGGKSREVGSRLREQRWRV